MYILYTYMLYIWIFSSKLLNFHNMKLLYVVGTIITLPPLHFTNEESEAERS